MHEPILGIDLGTTNSEVAIIRDGKPYVFEEDGDPILPSFVGLAEDGKLPVGKAGGNLDLGGQEKRPQEVSAMILRALKDRACAQLGVEVKKAVITVPAYFNDD